MQLEKSCNQYLVQLKKIFNEKEYELFSKLYKKEIERNKDFPLQDTEQIMKKINTNLLVIKDNQSFQVHNHLESNWNLSNKKALYYNLKSYYTAVGKNPFEFIPLTFHIQHGEGDPEFEKFK